MKLIARGLTAIGALAIAGLGIVQTVQAGDIRMQGGGASFPAPLYQRWVSEYEKLRPDVKIDYAATGSGAGIKGITDKTLDFAGSDAPLNKKEMEKMGGESAVIQVPSVAGAVVLGYNIPGFKGDLKLDGPTIADIFQGKIRTWNDPKIAASNPGTELPATPITTAHRTDGSGTTFIFTNYVCTQSSDFEDKVGKGKAVEWPSGQGGAQNAGVAAIIQQTNGAVGYIELAYAVKNKIAFAQVKNKDGNFIVASPDGVAVAGDAAAKLMTPSNLAVPLWDQPGAKTYPIAGFTYLIIYKDQSYRKDPAKAKALVDFLAWATHDGEKMAGELLYAPLSDEVQKKVSAKLAEAVVK